MDYAAYLPVALVYVWCARTAPWRRLADPEQLNVWCATIAALALMWSMNAGIERGHGLHLLGATLFTLMFGRQLAIVGLSVVMVAVTLNGALHGARGWEHYALNTLCVVVIPVSIAWTVLRAVERWLPAHFFVYIFVAAFFGAALNTVLTGLATTLVVGLTDNHPLRPLLHDYLLSYVLVAFAEAWLTGTMITLMVVYYPQWVSTFDDRRYLWKK